MRRWRIAMAAGLLAASLPAIAQAQIYTFLATPLIVSQGDVTDFTFTFTNEDIAQIGCAEVLFPDEFWITSLGTPKASVPFAWSATTSGQWVLAYADTGGGRLHTLESVTFTVTALATTQGSYIFDYHVHTRRDCTGPNLTGTVSVPLTVLPGATATPSPAPTAKATPTPTPTDTPTPSPKHTPDPRPTPDQSTPSPTPTGTPTPTSQATASPRASVPPPSSSASAGPPAIQVAPLGGGGGGAGGGPDDLGVGVDVLGMLDSPFEWLVPGAFVGGPGLLVILFVVLQAVGALAWIPAVRRMGDDDDDRRRRKGRRVSRGA